MRIFLTGGSGFIGRHLISLLRDHDVLCLTRYPNSLVCVALCRSSIGRSFRFGGVVPTARGVRGAVLHSFGLGRAARLFT